MKEILDIIDRTGSFVLDYLEIRLELVDLYRKFVYGFRESLKESENKVIDKSLLLQPIESVDSVATEVLLQHVNRLYALILSLSVSTESKDYEDIVLAVWKICLGYVWIVLKRWINDST